MIPSANTICWKELISKVEEIDLFLLFLASFPIWGYVGSHYAPTEGPPPLPTQGLVGLGSNSNPEISEKYFSFSKERAFQMPVK